MPRERRMPKQLATTQPPQNILHDPCQQEWQLRLPTVASLTQQRNSLMGRSSSVKRQPLCIPSSRDRALIHSHRTKLSPN